MARVYFYDKDLRPLADAVSCMTSRSYVLNQPNEQFGSATATIPLTEPKLTNGILKFGNIMYIRDPELGDWCGEVGEPLEPGMHDVDVNAISIETILADRHIKNVQFTDLMGANVQGLIEASHRQAPLVISIGDIASAKSPLGKVDTVGKTVLECIQYAQEMSGFEWGIEPSLTEGNVPYLSLWWRESTGVDLREQVALIEGVNIELRASPFVSWYGRIKNEIYVYAATLSGYATEPAVARNQESIDTYGLRQMAITENGVNQAGLQARANAEVGARAWPKRRFRPTVNKTDVFPYLRIGNIVRLMVRSVPEVNGGGAGIDTNVRVIGIATDDGTGTAELTTEEVT
jgi:hypothetical protein